jgi:TolA-binding protein
MQDMKEKFNRDTEIQKKNQNPKIQEMKSTWSQIKNSVANLSSRLDQIEDRLSRFEGKVDVLEQSDKEKIKKDQWNIRELWDAIKGPNL